MLSTSLFHYGNIEIMSSILSPCVCTRHHQVTCEHNMSEVNETTKDLNIVDDDDPKVEVNHDPSSEEVVNHLENPEDNPMPSPAQEVRFIHSMNFLFIS